MLAIIKLIASFSICAFEIIPSASGSFLIPCDKLLLRHWSTGIFCMLFSRLILTLFSVRSHNNSGYLLHHDTWCMYYMILHDIIVVNDTWYYCSKILKRCFKNLYLNKVCNSFPKINSWMNVKALGWTLQSTSRRAHSLKGHGTNRICTNNYSVSLTRIRV